MGLHLPEFPGADKPYKAAKNFRFGGYPILKGAPINAELVAEDKRERTLKLLYEGHSIVPLSDDEVAELPAPIDTLSDEQKARVTELVDGHTRDELNTLAAGEPFNIAAPEKMAKKDDVAIAIVKIETAAATA